MKNKIYLYFLGFSFGVYAQTTDLTLNRANISGNNIATNSVSMTANFTSKPTFVAKVLRNEDYVKAPNSYIFDVNRPKNDHGLFIPVRKAFAVASDILQNPISNNANLQAYVLWEDVPGLVIPNTANSYRLNLQGNGQNSRIKVEINRSKGKGNAVVALYDLPEGTVPTEDTPVIWSWHVWVTDNPTIDAVAGTKTLMDRNLGAVSANFRGHDWHKSAGLMFQWGRKDPFPPLQYKDESAYFISGIIGLKKPNVFQPRTANETWKRIDYNNPNTNPVENIKYVTNNPTTFLTSAANVSLNWWGGSNDLLWRRDRVKSTFDPCPNGYRVPKEQLINRNISLLNNNDNIKLYPSLGIDMSNSNNTKLMNLSNLPHTGVINFNRGEYVDNYSESHLTFSDLHIGRINQPSALKMTSDAHRLDVAGFGDTTYGVHSLSIEGESSYSGVACRCEVENEVVDFPTEYYTSNQITELNGVQFTNAVKQPNSYVVMTNTTNSNDRNLSIPLGKAYAMYYQHLTNNELPPAGQRAVSVFWTDNTNLINSISKTGNGEINDDLQLTLNPNQFGNAVVAIHENGINSPVLWSWHIWAPRIDPRINQNFVVSGKNTPTQVSYTTEDLLPISSNQNLVNPTTSGFSPLTTTFMNMNLGALNPYVGPITNLSIDNNIAYNPVNDSNSINSVGLLYQWGRKDPLPNPRMRTQINTLTKGNLNIRIREDYWYDSPNYDGKSSYDDNFSVNFNSLNNNNIKNILRYSVNNPLNFIFRDTTKTLGLEGEGGTKHISSDWLSDPAGLMGNRWGHGTEKSPFDPCPEGWRVPDVTIPKAFGDISGTGSAWEARESHGSSPFYYSKFNLPSKLLGQNIIINNGGIQQFSTFNPNITPRTKRSYVNITNLTEPNYPGWRITHHPGWAVGVDGWIFDSNKYNIGTFPATGIKGVAGDVLFENRFNASDSTPNYRNRTGIWLSSLESYTGYALAFTIGGQYGGTSQVFSGAPHHPMAAMACRCARDVERIPTISTSYNNITSFRGASDENYVYTEEEVKNIKLYPNPVRDILNIDSEDSYEYAIYNELSGNFIFKGNVVNKQINMSNLNSGLYILQLIKTGTNQVITNKIIKE